MPESISKSKGEKIECLAIVIRKGTAEFFPNPCEIPYIVFRLTDGREAKWHSDRCENCYWEVPEGTEVALSGFLYGKVLRRVQVSKGCAVWGKGGR